MGSFYDGGPMLIESMRRRVHSVAPGARLVGLTAPPVVGNVLLRMEVAGRDGTAARQRLIETSQALAIA